jgi:hypothetical protein
MDRFLEAVRTSGSFYRTRVAGFGRWLCEHGVKRQQAKAGLGLLGISGRPDDAALIVRLGLLEELTLYSVVALKNLLPDADPALYDLAQQVNGWGRIQCIYRLKDSALPEVRYWLRPCACSPRGRVRHGRRELSRPSRPWHGATQTTG